MGLSFAVPGDVDALAVTAEWAQYAKQEVLRRGRQEAPRLDPGTGLARAGVGLGRHCRTRTPVMATPRAANRSIHTPMAIRPATYGAKIAGRSTTNT